MGVIVFGGSVAAAGDSRCYNIRFRLLPTNIAPTYSRRSPFWLYNQHNQIRSAQVFMSRPSTSLTVALWGAVLGCCVWGVSVSQSATHIAGAEHIVGAQEARETGRQQDLAHPLASLAFWSDLLQTRTAEFGKLSLYPTADIYASGQGAINPGVSVKWISTSAEPHQDFAETRNRWSHGFH